MVIYEDEYCFIVNKASNVLVHHSHYARNIIEDSLIELLKQQNQIGYPVHRLDRKTSGLILFSKTKENVAAFQNLFEEDKIEKKYVALVRGFVPENGVVDSPVKNERGNYKEAETHFACLKTFELDFPVVPYPTARYSLVEFIPKTGRMHQLRIHANKMNHPIIGDPKHGNRHHNHFFSEQFSLNNLFLHAKSLRFFHPFSSQEISVEVSPPKFWDDFFAYCAL